MRPNVLLHAAPSSVMVGGAEVPIATSFRAGIRAMQAADDPELDKRQTATALLTIYFGQPSKVGGMRRIVLPPEVTAAPADALDAAVSFLNFNEPPKPRRASAGVAPEARMWDWDYDAPFIIADFRREYGVNLVDPGLEMHWWEFWPLFRGLGDTSLTMVAMAVRGADPKKLKGEERARLIARQRELALPARTEEERLRLTSLLWGLDV